jgi:hypothetical protein
MPFTFIERTGTVPVVKVLRGYWEGEMFGCAVLYRVMRTVITTFRSTTDRIYDGGPMRFNIIYYIVTQWYYNIIVLTTVLQLPTVFSTVICCTGL